MKGNVVLIMPYFGRLPSYFGTYLKSLEGKNMDVLWISDLDVPKHPNNFKIVKMSLDEVKERFEKVLGTKVVINGGRRLCDFRPMYAKAFEEFISGYDYWGWGDCDLVYGNAFNDYLARTVATGKYDAVSMHRDYMSGPTCFYRNTPKMRELYHKAANWQEVCSFEGPGGVFIFDECGGQFHAKLSAGKMTLAECAEECDSFSAVIWRTEGLDIYREDEIDEETLADGEVVTMKNGNLFIDGREIAVFHFVLAKVPRWFRFKNIPYEKVGNYWIDSTGFYHLKFAWYTRWLGRLIRKFSAAVEAVKAHGTKHIIKRIGL